MFFLGSLSSLVLSMQNQTRSTKWHSAINLSMRSTCLSSWSVSIDLFVTLDVDIKKIISDMHQELKN